MIIGLDHAVIGVRDLDEATEAYTRLGVDVRPGGRHTGRGTHNALVRFGPDYLELMGIYDREEAAVDPFAAGLLRFLQGRHGGLLGYVLASDNVAADQERLTRAGMKSIGPLAMSRKRADGGLLSWRMLIPGEISWRRAWPTIIQWDQNAAARAALDGASVHPNGVTHIQSVSLGVTDLEATTSSFARGLGLRAGRAESEPGLVARGRSVGLPNVELRVLAPTGKGPLQDEIERDGEGLLELVLDGPAAREFPTAAAMGARLRIAGPADATQRGVAATVAPVER